MFIRTLISATIVAASVSCASAGDISGAGATFPFPIYAKWADAYKTETGNGLNYQSIGSGAGIKQIKAKTVTFGATDAPLKPITIGHCSRPAASRSFGLQRRVGGAEGDGLGLDLLDAGAGADRLIVQPVAGRRLIGVRPFGVDREGERRAGAGYVAGVSAGHARRDDCRADQGADKHRRLSIWIYRPRGRPPPDGAIPRRADIGSAERPYMTPARQYHDTASH